MSATTPKYGWTYPNALGEVFSRADQAKFMVDVEQLFTAIGDVLGNGFFLPDSMSASIVPGVLQVSMSAGFASVGAQGSREIIWHNAPVVVGATEGVVGSGPGTLNYIWLMPSGLYVVNQSGTNPGDAEKAAEATFSATEATAVSNAPTGRINIGPASGKVYADANQAATVMGNANNEIGGLTISAAYSQAEVQALRDKCEELADDVRALHVLVHALRTAGIANRAIKGSA
jgi:hypothetical protein